MSDVPETCPDAVRLRVFLEGRLPAGDQEAVARHVERCAACCAALESWTAPRIVRAAEQRRQVEAPALEAMLARLKGAPPVPPGDTIGHSAAETGVPGSGPAMPATVPDSKATGDEVPLDFLVPSAHPGSLGRLGPYEVLDRIGQGGMGVVLKALDPRLNRIVALKVIAPVLATTVLARRRFTREAQAAAAVCHEHVVTIHAVDEAAGLPYLVMQLVAGKSLQDKIAREGPLGLKEILRIGGQVAAGLAAAHAQGLVHRDIKPANILLENGVERVKITDFGLARAFEDASLTDSGTVAGTPNYMSPEQARGDPLDQRSDLFSLGSVLYAMCTGRAPFRADTTLAVLRKVSDEPPPPIRERNPEVPDRLIAIVGRLMVKDPAGRYPSAAEVARVLVEYLAEVQQPGPLKPPVAGSSGPRGFWALAIAVLLVAAGLVLAFAMGRSVSTEPPGRAGPEPAATKPPLTKRLSPAPAARPRARYYYDEQFPGLVPLPVAIPGLHRWQLATRYSRADMTGLAWSPDGTEVACCGDDELVRVLDGETLRLLRSWPVRQVQVLDWSPDGRWIASGDWEGTIRLSVAADGSSGPVFADSGSLVQSVAFSPDSRRLVAAGRSQRTIRVWNIAERTVSPVLDHPQGTLDAAWSPDGTLIATACQDGLIRTWDATSGSIVRTLKGHTGEVTSLAFDGEGRRLISTGADRQIRVWGLAQGVEEKSWAGGGNVVAVSRQGLVGGCLLWDRSIPLWNLDSGLQGPLCGRHEDSFRPLPHVIRFRGDGLGLASVSADGTLRTWNVKTGAPNGILPRPSPQTTVLAFDASGETLGSTAYLGGDPRLWRVSDGTLRRVLKGHKNPRVPALAFSPDGREVAGGGGGDQPVIQLWDAGDGTAGAVLQGGHSSEIRSLVYTPDGRRLVSGGGQVIEIWDRATGAIVRRLTGSAAAVFQLRISPDGRTLLSSHPPVSIQAWDLETGVRGPEIRGNNPQDAVNGAVFGPAGETFAVEVAGGLRVFNAATGVLVRDLPTIAHVTNLAYSPDGRFLAATDYGGNIEIWDAGVATPRLLRGPGARFLAIVFAPDSRLIATGGRDGAIRLWNARTGTVLRVLLALSGDHAAAIEPSGGVTVNTPAAENELVYLAQQRADGPVENLTSAEFRSRYGPYLPKPGAESRLP